jgi:hypothetical protein
MLEYVYRYNVKYEKAAAFRDWLVANDQALHDHQTPGWTYLGAWFSVRGFGQFQAESRFQLEGYEASGSGPGDDETQRYARELAETYIDWTTKPMAALYRTAHDVRIAPR